MKIHKDFDNETHSGEITVDVFQELPVVFFRIIAENPKQKFIDQTVNFCKWCKSRHTNFLIKMFTNYYEKYSNPELMECPIKKGFYIILKAREIITKPHDFLPSLLPLKGNITLILSLKVRIAGKTQDLSRSTKIYELY